MVSESKVGGIVAALRDLENDMDTLNSTVSDMKRQLSIRVQKETDALYEKTQEMANAQAEKIIEETRAKANTQASNIAAEAESKLENIRRGIEGGFDDAVQTAVDTILKPAR